MLAVIISKLWITNNLCMYIFKLSKFSTIDVLEGEKKKTEEFKAKS